MERDLYKSPFSFRYASEEMQRNFSEQTKVVIWRKLWILLAQAQKNLGLPIKEDQIDEMEQNIHQIDWDFIALKEKEVKHDVMSHVHGFAKVCPRSAGVIHLGATSADITDNADLIIYKDGLRIILKKLKKVLYLLSQQFLQHGDTLCLGYTHFQSAQPIFFAKRIAFWANDLGMDFIALQRLVEELPFKGFRGAVGTRVSYISLFQSMGFSIKQANAMAIKMSLEIANKMSFASEVQVCSQTYTRKIDTQILNVLSAIAESASKFACDIRLLCANNELSEPFEKYQIGSSAMPHKRNPVKSERICSLSRYVMGLPPMMANTSANQWLERSLDDSALRRVIMPDSFLAVDGILDLYASILLGLHVNKSVMEDRVYQEMPMIASEYLLMRLSSKGANRQDIHEKIRKSAVKVKQLSDLGEISKKQMSASWEQALFEEGIDLRDTLSTILQEWPAWSVQPEFPSAVSKILFEYLETEDPIIKV